MAAAHEQPAPADAPPPFEAINPPAQTDGSRGIVPLPIGSTPAPDPVQPYDFRRPVFLTASQLRRLRLRHEEFIRSLAARLSIYLRLEFSLKLANLHTLSYQKFIAALPEPAHLSIFKAEPMRGVGILDIHPRLGLAIVDRQLGGSAAAINTDREPSEIELALLDQAVHLILAEWCQHWMPLQELRPSLLGHETSGRFLQAAAHDTVLLVLTLEAKIGDCVEPMQIALPCHMLEPLVRKLGPPADETPAEPSRPTASVKWNHNFDGVPVPVAAVWSDLQLTAREIANLKVGDVLPLPADCAQQVRLRLGSVAKFEGQLGTRGGKWAVSVTRALNVSP